jgi:hypothetical protein
MKRVALPLIVVLLLTLGRSVVLFANRVGRRRFSLSLVLSALDGVSSDQGPYLLFR